MDIYLNNALIDTNLVILFCHTAFKETTAIQPITLFGTLYFQNNENEKHIKICFSIQEQ